MFILRFGRRSQTGLGRCLVRGGAVCEACGTADRAQNFDLAGVNRGRPTRPSNLPGEEVWILSGALQSLVSDRLGEFAGERDSFLGFQR